MKKLRDCLKPDKSEGVIGKYVEILIMGQGIINEIIRIASQEIKRSEVKQFYNYKYKDDAALAMNVTVDLN